EFYGDRGGVGDEDDEGDVEREVYPPCSDLSVVSSESKQVSCTPCLAALQVCRCGGCRKRRGETRMAGGGGGGGGSAGAAPKQDDTQPHPVKEQLPNISYCITSPPPWRTGCWCWDGWMDAEIPEDHAGDAGRPDRCFSPPDRNRLQRPMAFRHKVSLIDIE
ncbi:hypothetical protein B296_00031963, partial [Ensete ventricosum]